ncbi:LRP2-binding protein isoform X2 [Esox lucius]|uniref:LRP2-binding protein n=1 Tax=Esox lucius TaxID=8010 RepID=A0A3P8Y7W0_ESOLU|nr:LRP2-binding protein isoform X2 [Esox lucius]
MKGKGMNSGCNTEALEEHRSAHGFRAIADVYGKGKKPTSSEDSLATPVERDERLLKVKAEARDKHTLFLLGQLHYEQGRYFEALEVFDAIKDHDPRALFQLAIMYYDGLGTAMDLPRAVDYMKSVFQWNVSETGSIRYTALYNIGRAYLEGYGVPQSSTEAESHWLLAADNGNPNASVKAQSSLGMFYSRRETKDLERAFFWHSEACGNGSLESQAALGIMYLYGLGIHQDPKSAVECLKEASERGNVYAQAHLVAYYYHRKLYTNTAALAQRIISYNDIAAIARVTDCLPEYIIKGMAIALFYYGRCLHLGKGVLQSKDEARHYFTKAAQLNPEVCQDLQMDIILGKM